MKTVVQQLREVYAQKHGLNDSRLKLPSYKQDKETKKIAMAVKKNRSALIQLVRANLAKPEDARMADEVQNLLVKTAIEAGMNQPAAEDISWMEELESKDNVKMTPGDYLYVFKKQLLKREDLGSKGGFEGPARIN